MIRAMLGNGCKTTHFSLPNKAQTAIRQSKAANIFVTMRLLGRIFA